MVYPTSSNTHPSSFAMSLSISTSSSPRGPLRLPLLEGLAHQKSTADVVVKEALHSWRAARRISIWCGTIWRNRKAEDHPDRRKKKRRRTDENNKNSGNDSPGFKPGSSSAPAGFNGSSTHWLFQSLQSPSAPERQVACRILATGCPLEAHTLWQLLDILVGLLQHQTRKGPTAKLNSSSVTLVTLIKHILILPQVPGMDSKNIKMQEGNSVPTAAAGSPSNNSTSNGTYAAATSTTTSGKSGTSNLVMPFLLHKRMGLSWICTTLWKRAAYESEPSAVSAALVDLLYQILMVGTTQETLDRAHGFLWKTEINTGLSPLGCLVATQLVWKQGRHHMSPAQKDVLHVMKQLLDPHTAPTKLRSSVLGPALELLTTVTSTETLRLMDTFRPPPSLDATTTAIAEALANAPASASRNSGTDSNVSPGLLTAAGSSGRGDFSSSTERSATAPAVSRIFSSVYGPSSPGATRGQASSPAAQQALELFGTGSPLGALVTRSATATASSNSRQVETADATTAGSNRTGAASSLNRTSGGTSDIAPRRDGSFSAAMDIVGRNSEDEEDDQSGEEDDGDDDEDHDYRYPRHDYDEDEEHEHQSNDEEAEDHDAIEAHHDQDEDEEDEHEEGEHQEDNEQEIAPGRGRRTERGEEEEVPVDQVDNNNDKGEEDEEDEEEEIESDEEDCEFDNEEGGGSSGEHDIVIHDPEDEEDEDDIAGFRQSLMEIHDTGDEERPCNTASATSTSGKDAERLAERKHAYLKACMKVLSTQHAPWSAITSTTRPSRPLLPVQAEQDLMNSVLNIVKPPKKPVNAKIILRRAPTQEDFFRGSLSKNPISLHQLRKDANQEPTFSDLRQYIADDLQMSDSSELLELLVANKIIDMSLKLRVVHQVVWKQHLMQNSGGGPSNANSALSSLLGGGRGVARSLISARSGLSMIFSTGGVGGPGASSDAQGNAITEDTPLSALPPMVITYRLAGVDGEATEDTVSTLEDPEAPSEAADLEEKENRLEKEFGITRSVTEGRGVFCLLKSLERHIYDTLRKIRRDDVGSGDNLARNHFKTSAPYSGLALLSCCAKLASNRKLLLQARAPTILLRLLLDVLHALEDEGLSESNPTAKELQELIEVLATDMMDSNGVKDVHKEIGEDAEQDASTLRLLLSAIETSSLSRPLRNVIAKLLPYLTYGQPALSKELASEFVRHVDLSRLGEYELETKDYSQVLMATFVHASTSLPANDVCNSLRSELIHCGYVDRVASFILQDCPLEPPSWTSPLWAKGNPPNARKKTQLEKQWRNYIQRPGLKSSFDMLVGLSKEHKATKGFVGNVTNKQLSLIEACHWIEATSDNTSARISMGSLGLAAETLLDELAMEGSPVAAEVRSLRTETRNRKKEIAMERRSKALVSMGAFGVNKASFSKSSEEAPAAGARGTATSFLAPVLGLFQNSETTQPPPAKRRKKEAGTKNQEDEPSAKPAWMAEMEDMEDETGLTCAVCQEGRKLQPSELLGLYAYVKKVSVPLSQCGGRNHIDGTTLLTALPASMPASLSDSHAATEWFPAARATSEDLKESSRSSLSSVANSRRATYFTTTVSAGNAIHFNCHNRARQADRNHPKAPKSEWEGASLRNSRVNCNVIMPLVSSRSSKVPLVAVDVALTEHQTAISNLLGARPKSMLWNILHDVRFLILRMAYEEPLNADCGGGSLASNSQLIFHQLLMADMFEKDAQVDAPEMAQHARNLSAGFLAASAITHAYDFNNGSQSLLHRGLADSSVMASLTCILFHNTKDDYGASAASASSSTTEDKRPHPKRRWMIGRDYFLRGLLNCAGRRHALGVEGSGCITSRNSASKRRRPTGFADWDIVEDEMLDMGGGSTASGSGTASASMIRSNSASIEDFRDPLRPMIIFFAIMDQLSEDFVLKLDDERVEEMADRLTQVINDCRTCKNMQELLQKARVTLQADEIIEELQKGMISA